MRKLNAKTKAKICSAYYERGKNIILGELGVFEIPTGI
jgi:hypothetical protein